MKRIALIGFLILFLVLSTSCTNEYMNISDNIEAPENNNLPITGKWLVDDYKLSSESTISEELAKYYLGNEVIFHEKVFAMGEDYFINPLFKIKNVKTLDYFIYQYNISPRILDIDEEESQIISISEEDQLRHVFIKKSHDTILVNIDGGFFYLKKISEEVEEEIIAEYIYADKARFKAVNIKEEDILSSGVLIGLKSLEAKEKEDDLDKWNYRTIFTRSYNKDLINSYEGKNIFLPRKTGFWNIEVDREKIGNKINDSIAASPQGKSSELGNGAVAREEVKGDNSLKNILYIGNDYISLEKINLLNRGEKLLELHPIDNLIENKPILFKDVIGDIGEEIFIEDTRDLKFNDESFGLFRRNGQWVFKGRHNFIEDNEEKYEDFNIKAIPPEEIVQYDKLSVSWNTIKSKVPGALDAFMSPNDDMILILTRNNILIHLIYEGEISDIPGEKIELKPGEEPIMVEWATGKYPLLWEEEFLKNHVRSIR